MPEPTTPSTQYRKTRHDHASETAEDYVEAIQGLIEGEGSCRVMDLARRLGISHVTVVRTVQRLKAEGLVETAPYRPIELTAKGRRLARWSKERHELVQSFLLALGVSPTVAADDAEGIEHHCSPATLKAMKTYLDKDKTR